jgi:predicted amidohydrolase
MIIVHVIHKVVHWLDTIREASTSFTDFLVFPEVINLPAPLESHFMPTAVSSTSKWRLTPIDTAWKIVSYVFYTILNLFESNVNTSVPM